MLVSLDHVAFVHSFVHVYVDLKIKLANSTEAELRSLQSSLHSSKDDTNLDLRRNVFKQYVSNNLITVNRLIYASPPSYAEFVMISKEIGSLENEMLELKESLAEWKSMPSLLHIDDTASAAGASSLSTLQLS